MEVAWSGISTGTERLLWSGRMPDFPGMGYPLVPGYESVGIVVEAGPDSGRRVGETVFVPGARCFGPVRGLFGGAASHLVSAGRRLRPIPESLGERGILLALAATARHALKAAPRKGASSSSGTACSDGSSPASCGSRPRSGGVGARSRPPRPRRLSR